MQKVSKKIFWILSPSFLSTVLTICAIISVFFPPDIYSDIIGEKNYMFANSKVLLFVAVGYLAYLIGTFIPFLSKNKISIRLRAKYLHPRPKDSESCVIIIILVLVIALLSIYIIYILLAVSIDYFLGKIFASEGSALRIQLFDITSEMKLGWVLNFSAALMLWPYFLRSRNKFWIKNLTGKIFELLFLSSTILFVMACMLTLTRGALFQFILMIVVVSIFSRIQKRELNYIGVLKIGLFSLFGLVLVFWGIGYLRSSTIGHESGYDEFIKLIVGYFPASYNRLAAVMEGVLEYPASGIGFYSFRWLFEFPFLSRALDFNELGKHLVSSNFPESNFDLFLNHFLSVENAGMNASFTWKTLFGAVYIDFGWIAPFWLLFYGMVSGIIFKSFLRGQVFGITVYPIFVVGIAHWWSGYVFTREIDIQIAAALFIFCIDYIIRLALSKDLKKIQNSCGRYNIFSGGFR